jgi:hypothetical protein
MVNILEDVNAIWVEDGSLRNDRHVSDLVRVVHKATASSLACVKQTAPGRRLLKVRWRLKAF